MGSKSCPWGDEFLGVLKVNLRSSKRPKFQHGDTSTFELTARVRIETLKFCKRRTFQLTFIVATILSFHLWLIWQTRQGEWLSRITNKTRVFSNKERQLSFFVILHILHSNKKKQCGFFYMEISCAQPYSVTFIKILAFRSKRPKRPKWDENLQFRTLSETTSRSFHGVSPRYIAVKSMWCKEQEWLKYLSKQTPPSWWLCEGLLRSLWKKI